jgi:hypothetical protein
LIEGAAAFVVWLGVALVVLADGRRGLSAGLALVTIALSVFAWENGGMLGSAALLLGGGAAAMRRVRSGPEGWAVMPPGSTPRVILCVGAALLALWIAASLTSGPGAGLRFAVLAAVGLAGARIMSSDDPSALMTAAGALALALALSPALDGESPGIALYAIAGIVAAVAAWLPPRDSADAA